MSEIDYESFSTRLKRGASRWWISIALGHRCGAVFLNGQRETWKTEEVGKGLVFGIHFGQIDDDAPLSKEPSA